MTTELTTLPPKETALQVFSAPAGLDPYLAQIKAELDAFAPDVSTKKGRDAIASIAYKVARCKTALDDIGKDLVAELKDVPKKIDAERKRMRDLLDQWKDDVRRPLTEWEQAEEARIALHKADLQGLADQAAGLEGLSCEAISARIALVQATVITEARWEEYESEAHRAKAVTLEALNAALVKRQAYEAEQAELARLRAEAAEREQKEREERIAREAAERAKQEAEAKARAEQEASERRELGLKLAAEKAEREKLEAEQRAAQAVKDAEARATAAAEAERQQIAREQAAALEQQKKREADKEHRAAINRQALANFVAGGLSEEYAKLAVRLIAQGKVSNVVIHY